MIDALAAIVEWFNKIAQDILKVAQEAYHKIYKGETDYEA